MCENLLLRVGFGRTDITGTASLPMGGYGDPLQRTSQGVLIPLCATCIAITDPAGETVLLYTLDHLCTNQDWMADLRSAVSDATGVPAHRILLSATHTHSGPDIRDTITREHPYYAYFRAQLALAGTLSMADRAKAWVFFGDTHVQDLNFVRHYVMDDGNMAGDNFGDAKNHKAVRNHHKADDQVQLLRFSRQDKKDILLLNFGVHAKLSSAGCTRYGKQNRLLLSSDIPGATRAFVEANAPVLCAYFQGAAGNLNPIEPYLGAPNPEKRRSLEGYGKALGEAVLEAMDSLQEMEAAPRLKSKQTLYKTLHKKDDSPLALELDALCLGNIGFVTAPYEMFDTNGRQIKEGSPFTITFVITYANGRFAYVADRDAWEYPTADGSIPWELRLGYVKKGIAEDLVREFLDLLRELKDA